MEEKDGRAVILEAIRKMLSVKYPEFTWEVTSKGSTSGGSRDRFIPRVTLMSGPVSPVEEDVIPNFLELNELYFAFERNRKVAADATLTPACYDMLRHIARNVNLITHRYDETFEFHFLAISVGKYGTPYKVIV